MEDEDGLTPISASIPKKNIAALDVLVETGRYRSRSHAIDVAIRQLLERTEKEGKADGPATL